MASECNVLECSKPAVAYGLCDMHRLRLREHGHLNPTRPPDWGKREKHKLYGSWNWMRRMRTKYSIDEKWEDFWQFVKDVGNRPSENHKLVRPDKNSGYGPKNFQWSEYEPDFNAVQYSRKWRKENPDLVKNTNLQSRYGITLFEYRDMLDKQGGTCAICRGNEPTGHALAVDHCHETKRIRGLLCTNCNKVLGHAKDDPDVLFAAIQYLRNVEA